MPVISAPSIDLVRAKFPALASGFAYMDNAGGSQMPAIVADAIHSYMLNTFVQVGATYSASVMATRTVQEAHSVVNTMFNGHGLGEVILGASTSALCRMLSDCYAEVLKPGDEVIVAENGHEANVYPWVVLAHRGTNVKMWRADPDSGDLHLDELRSLLSDKTRIVALPHVSNILGFVENIDPIVDLAHSVGARVILDSVALAPHHALDVIKTRVDFCVFSCYKVFGPHMAAMWGSLDALSDITGRNHPFVDKSDLPYKFELGGVLHEGCAGLVALPNYFSFLAGQEPKEFGRQTVVDAFNVAADLEEPLCRQTMEFLTSKPKVRIVGPSKVDASRVATISFVHENLRPEEIVAVTDQHQIGIRFGNFYSVRLLERMGIDSNEGVARVSLAHYTSTQEVDRLIQVLDPIL